MNSALPLSWDECGLSISFNVFVIVSTVVGKAANISSSNKSTCYVLGEGDFCVLLHFLLKLSNLRFLACRLQFHLQCLKDCCFYLGASVTWLWRSWRSSHMCLGFFSFFFISCHIKENQRDETHKSSM